MNRVGTPALLAIFLGVTAMTTASSAEPLPAGNAPPALDFPYFPDRAHAFVWRNWSVADMERMVRVLGAGEDAVRAMGESMGLPPYVPPSELERERGYITVIRRNWHLLPYDQILQLLDWDAERLAYTLKEDDFLWVKLGKHKPDCPPLRYREPNAATRARCAQIRAVVAEHFGDRLAQPPAPRFGFVETLSAAAGPAPVADATGEPPLRLVYSYFAVYGDPLLDPALDPYPDGLLERLARQGVNGIWLHTVLRQLAPSADFPDFGEGADRRLAGLRGLVERARRYGIRVYLYVNEPRNMPAAWFAEHRDLAGAREDEYVALCTSVPRVLRYVREGLAYVFREVPGLGGVFAITASENLTNCWSRGTQAGCPRCAGRDPAEVIAEVNLAIAEGVWSAAPEASVILWDWGWRDDWAQAIIRRLPPRACLMSVSEWSLPIERGGIPHAVGEYSMSCVGPGPRALRHWGWARERGLRTIAKVQVNCTWELSAVPWLPVGHLVGRHLANLAQAGVDGLMLSWTLGGYPSPNLALVREFDADPPPEVDDALRRVAEQRYGTDAAPDVLAAWERFSAAFEHFPFDVPVVYGGPCQVGPANLLYAEPSGYGATMVGMPYDDLETWRGIYPAEVYAAQFEALCEGWTTGLARLRRAAEAADSAAVREDLRLAEAAYAHFRSVANQARFVQARNALAAGNLPVEERARLRDRIRKTVTDEIGLAVQLLELVGQDARIGFEASNHYYYVSLDLVEKVINCRYLLDEWLPGREPAKEEP